MKYVLVGLLLAGSTSVLAQEVVMYQVYEREEMQEATKGLTQQYEQSREHVSQGILYVEHLLKKRTLSENVRAQLEERLVKLNEMVEQIDVKLQGLSSASHVQKRLPLQTAEVSWKTVKMR